MGCRVIARRSLPPLSVLAVLVMVGMVVLSMVVLSANSAGATPGTQVDGARTLVVSETAFPSSGGGLTVSSTGFDPKIDLYLGVCAADIAPSDALIYCIGGPIPDENTSKSWAVVTNTASGKKNAVTFGDGGSFTATLNIASPVGSSVDCVEHPCVLIARSVGHEASRPTDITEGIGFAAASSTSSSVSTSEEAAIIDPDSILLPEARVGDQQTVVFTGYSPGEGVRVTVFSDPIDIPNVKASASGIVTISFPITTALRTGAHIVQAVGANSGRVGVANFQVLDPLPVTTSETSSTESSTTSSSAESTTSATPTTTSASATVTSTTSTSAVVVPTTPPSSSSNLWWLWVTLALLVVVGGLTGAVALSRRRAQQLEQERLDREHQLAQSAVTRAPSWRQTGHQPHDPAQAGGLLSGHDGDGPALYSGQTGGFQPPRYEEPTQRIPTPPREDIGESTGSWLHDLGSDDPLTQRWSPDDEDPPRGPTRR